MSRVRKGVRHGALLLVTVRSELDKHLGAFLGSHLFSAVSMVHPPPSAFQFKIRNLDLPGTELFSRNAFTDCAEMEIVPLPSPVGSSTAELSPPIRSGSPTPPSRSGSPTARLELILECMDRARQKVCRDHASPASPRPERWTSEMPARVVAYMGVETYAAVTKLRCAPMRRSTVRTQVNCLRCQSSGYSRTSCFQTGPSECTWQGAARRYLLDG